MKVIEQKPNNFIIISKQKNKYNRMFNKAGEKYKIFLLQNSERKL